MPIETVLPNTQFDNIAANMRFASDSSSVFQNATNAMLGFLGLIALAIIAGCAAVPTVEQSSSSTSNLNRYESLQFSVDGTEAMRQTAGFEATSTALDSEFKENVVSKGRFKEVGPKLQGSNVLVARLTITELNYVHGATRGMVGVFAGRAVLNVTMTLIDKGTGAVLSETKATHTSSPLQGVFSPVTSTQITAIAKEFAAKVTAK